MKTLVLKVPGKSFLAGEYLALLGGPNLVAATKPAFELRVRAEADTSSAQLFHTESPAGRFARMHADFFNQFSLQWIVPEGSLGFGSSTAEFVALHALFQMRETLWIEQERHFDLREMLRAYRECAVGKNGREGWVPSGADLVAQVRGGITCLETKTGKIQSFAWPFDRIGFCLMKTGIKLATHEHLQNLGDFESAGLEKCTYELTLALQNLQEQEWITGISHLAKELHRLDFVAPQTEKLIGELQSLPFLAMKGCGALGADVVVGFYKNENEEKVRLGLEEKGLKISATQKDLSEGLTVQVEE